MLRRLILKRGLTALLGAAALGGNGPVSVQPGYNSLSPAAASGMGDNSHEQRSMWARIFDKQRNDLWRRNQMRHDAWNNQDGDLLALGSTSRAWRASVMLDRIKRKYTVMDALDEKINQIWAEPVHKLQTIITSWIRGDA